MADLIKERPKNKKENVLYTINLKNPDIIEVNGDKFQILEHNSSFLDTKKDDVEFEILLIKVGATAISPTHIIKYWSKHHVNLTFWAYNTNKRKYEEIKIKSINLSPHH